MNTVSFKSFGNWELRLETGTRICIWKLESCSRKVESRIGKLEFRNYKQRIRKLRLEELETTEINPKQTFGKPEISPYQP